MLKFLDKFKTIKLNTQNFSNILKLDKDKKNYILIILLLTLTIFIIDITNKNISKKNLINKVVFSENEEMLLLKKYILNNVKSPFNNISYKIKRGDTLKKILKNYSVNNQDIDRTVSELRKYTNAANLKSGNIIEIATKNEGQNKKNKLQKISIPMSKSITIEIFRDDEGVINSEKIITRLFKKLKIAENTIEKNLYSAAVESKIEPNVINTIK